MRERWSDMLTGRFALAWTLQVKTAQSSVAHASENLDSGSTFVNTSQFVYTNLSTLTPSRHTSLVSATTTSILAANKGGYHPHGFISMGAFGNFATEGTDWSKKFPGITNSLLTLNGNFRLPLYKEYLQALGLASVSRRSCEALLYQSLLDSVGGVDCE